MRHLKLILRTLFSNNACIEAARTKEKKYNIIAIALALFAVFFAVLPTPIKSFQVNGSNFLSQTYKYDMDTGLYNFTKSIKDNPSVAFTLNEKKELTVTNFNGNTVYTAVIPNCLTDHKGYLNNLYRYQYVNTENKLVGMEVYVAPDENEYSTTNLGKYVAYIISNLNPMLKAAGVSDENAYLDYEVKDGVATKVNRSTSFIVFGKNSVYGYSYKPGTTTAIGGRYGDYHHITSSTNIIADMFVELTASVNGVEKTYNNWKEFFDRAYIDTRFASTWQTTGITIGVDLGILFFMGLMVFILTRGKNNPFRIYSFWDSQKIAYYASFTPGLLALGLGFLLSNMGMMFFILMLGIRVMWLSMRTLRYTAAAK